MEKYKLGLIRVLSFKQLIQQYIQKYGASVTWKGKENKKPNFIIKTKKKQKPN